MPKITIQGTSLSYAESDIVSFDEGLIGLPQLRRMVLVRQEGINPFMWLASLDEEGLAFLVAEPSRLFQSYAPALPSDARAVLKLDEGVKPLTLAIVVVATDWARSTMNLRAPLFINARTMRGAQVVLTEGSYRLDEPLPLLRAA